MKASQAFLGEVILSNATYALNKQQNGYQPHTQLWSYIFHSNLPNPSSAIGGARVTYHRGDTISFVWIWNSVANPNEGDYGYVNCIYDPSVN